ncbi:MAG TPA: DUF1494 domain-containing protein [Rhabdochlamydiaceae bacterium]|nr:DUF1494 domain-containing protein [Rhabdochlamydiaceae bacterium]
MKLQHRFTLLEIVIAMTLTAFLITVLFSFYRESSMIGMQLEQAKQKILLQELFQERMTQVFNQIRLEEGENKDKEPPLFTSSFIDANGPVLNLYYDNGVDHQPEFCDMVKGMLYVNQHKELCFTTSSKENLTRKDVFFDGVAELRFYFFDPDEKEWVSFWKKEKHALPSMVKLSMSLKSNKKKQLEFVYFLTSKKQEIIYKSL